ncbi:MAG: hypothetical protein K6E47_11635 [Lachnospiraceae bacterium]|nr:hypothetical protein [Lachnospiraceae bacterium]
MMKKYLIFLVLLFLAIISSGCSNKKSITIETSEKTETTEDIPVNPKEKDTVAENEPLKQFSISSEEDINNLSDEDVIYLATHEYKTTDFVEDFKADPYNDFGTPLEGYEMFEPYMLDPGGERKDYDVNRKISDQDFKKLAEEHMNSLIVYNDIEVVYFGETNNYVQYGLASSQQYGFTRRCFYRNIYMLSDTLDGHFYAGPNYLGELTLENVLLEADFEYSYYFDSYLLLRGVEERQNAIVYTCYSPNWKQFGDYDEREENQKAEIIKTEIFYDKETHRITGESTVIRSVVIPDTKLFYDEPC